MKFKTIKVLTIAAVVLGAVACKEKSNPVVIEETNSTTMYTMNTTSYWINGSYKYDSTNAKSAYTSYDSTYITQKTTYQGKDAYNTIKMQGSQDGKFTTPILSYYSSFNDNEYLMSGAFLKSILDYIPEVLVSQLNLNLPIDKWYTIANNKKDTSALLENSIEVTDVSVPNLENVKLDLSFNIYSIRMGNTTETDPVNQKSIKGVKFDLNSRITVKVKIDGISIDLPLPKSFINLHTYLTFGEGIGLMKMDTPTQDVKFSVDYLIAKYDIYKFMVQGRGFELLRYKN